MSANRTMGPSTSAAGVAAKAANNLLRARWLTRVASGEITALNVIDSCAQGGPALEPLRRLQINMLLAAQPDWGPKRVRTAMALLRRWCDVNPELPTKSLTVSWVLDGKTKGSRFTVLADVVAPRVAPWPGFPHAADLGGTPWT